MTVKLLTEHNFEFLSLKGGRTGSSEFTLVKMPHCWKSHVTAHLLLRLWPAHEKMITKFSIQVKLSYDLVLAFRFLVVYQ